MEKIKLVAVDLDGTALNSDGKMSPLTLKTLKALSTKNIKLVIASGRPLYQIKNIIDKLALTTENDFTVSLNGSVVVNNYSHEILFCNFISHQLLREIYNDVIESDLDTLIMFDADNSSFNKMLLHCKGFEDEVTKNYLTNFAAQKENVTACLYTNQFDININKIYISSYTPEVNKFVKKWQNQVEISQEIRGDRSSLEITTLGITKAAGIAAICKKYNLSAKNVMAFGNEHNDEAMLKWAGYGVAMGNAPNDIKDIADIIAEDNDHDGIAKIIQKYIFE